MQWIQVVENLGVTIQQNIFIFKLSSVIHTSK